MRSLRTTRAISARACRAGRTSPLDFRPDVSGNPSRSVTRAARRPRPALPARSPPPLVRSPAETPSPATGRGEVWVRFSGRCVDFGLARGSRGQGVDFARVVRVSSRTSTGFAAHRESTADPTKLCLRPLAELRESLWAIAAIMSASRHYSQFAAQAVPGSPANGNHR